MQTMLLEETGKFQRALDELSKEEAYIVTSPFSLPPPLHYDRALNLGFRVHVSSGSRSTSSLARSSVPLSSSNSSAQPKRSGSTAASWL